MLSDLTGLTGLRLVRAIVQGDRAPQELAPWRDPRGKASAETSARALHGTWQPEPLCAVPQSLALSAYDHEQSRDGARVSEEHLQGMAWPEGPPLEPRRRGRRRKDNAGTFDARQRLHPVTGVALTASEGSEESPARVVLRAIGTDRSRWPSEQPCGSGLGLAPHPKKSGGKGKASATRPGSKRAAQALRLAAKHLQRSQSALGAFFRRIAARRGVAQALTATAYTLARLVSALLQHGMTYGAQGLEAYATAYRERVVRQGKRKAAALGLMGGARDAEAPPS